MVKGVDRARGVAVGRDRATSSKYRYDNGVSVGEVITLLLIMM